MASHTTKPPMSAATMRPDCDKLAEGRTGEGELRTLTMKGQGSPTMVAGVVQMRPST